MDLYDEYIRTHLSYDPDTGVVGWSRSNGGRSPKVAGNLNNGYRRIKCKGKKFLAHRIAWFLHYEEWPKQEVDHINGDKLDNRISNLRDVSLMQNQQNTGMKKTGKRKNTSGWKGVSWNKKSQKWQAEIRYNGAHQYLGMFDDIREAAEEYIFAAIRFHGEFARF